MGGAREEQGRVKRRGGARELGRAREELEEEGVLKQGRCKEKGGRARVS